MGLVLPNNPSLEHPLWYYTVFSSLLSKSLQWSWHFGVRNVEVESLLIGTKCQFDITWPPLLPCFEMWTPSEGKLHHTPRYGLLWSSFEWKYDSYSQVCLFSLFAFWFVFLFWHLLMFVVTFHPYAQLYSELYLPLLILHLISPFCSKSFTCFVNFSLALLHLHLSRTHSLSPSSPLVYRSPSLLPFSSISSPSLISISSTLDCTPTCHHAFFKDMWVDVFVCMDVPRHPDVLVTSLVWCSSCCWCLFVCLPPTAIWSSLAMPLPQEDRSHTNTRARTYVLALLSLSVLFSQAHHRKDKIIWQVYHCCRL